MIGCLTTDRAWEIYTLTDPRTLRARYVGVTHRSEKVRYRDHLQNAAKGKTHLHKWICSLLRLDEKPIYLALEYGRGEGWQDREKFWIAVHRKFCDLVNATDGGDGVTGYAHTQEARAKCRAVNLGRKKSPETCEKMRVANLGKRLSPEHRAKLSVVRLGKKASPEACAKNRAARIGKKRSPETCAKLRAAHLGKKRSPLSVEHRRKLSVALKGKLRRPHSPETRAKMSATRKGRPGRPQSLETRAKLRAANLGKRLTPEHKAKTSAANL